MIYSEIRQIIVPTLAASGDLVTVQVRVRNLHTTAIYIAVTGQYDSVDIPFSPDYATVGAGATYSFTSSFTMPNNDVRLRAWSWYWTGTEWAQDDYAYADIELLEVVVPEPEFRGFAINEYVKR